MNPATRNITLRSAYVAGALLLLTMAFIVVKTGRDALYIQDDGILHLPLAYVNIALSAAPAAMLTLLAMRALGPRRTRLGALLLVMTLLFLYFPFASPGPAFLNTAFFIGVPVVWGILFSLSWLLGADLLEGATHAELGRSYGLIGGASILGGTVGALIAKVVADIVEPRTLILMGAFMLLGAALTIARAHWRFPPVAPADGTNEGARGTSEPAQEKSSGFRDYLDIMRRPYAGLLFFVAMFGAAGGVLVEFQFYLAAASLGDAQQSAGFFAQFYLVLNASAFVVQVLVMPRLQRVAGVYGSLTILPLALAGGAAGLVLTGGSATLRAWLRVAEGGLKSSIYRANWEQAYLPLGKKARTIAKLLVDGMGARAGEALGAMAFLLWLQLMARNSAVPEEGHDLIFYLMLAIALVWVLIIFRLRHSAGLDPILTPEIQRVEIPVPDG